MKVKKRANHFVRILSKQLKAGDNNEQLLKASFLQTIKKLPDDDLKIELLDHSDQYFDKLHSSIETVSEELSHQETSQNAAVPEVVSIPKLPYNFLVDKKKRLDEDFVDRQDEATKRSIYCCYLSQTVDGLSDESTSEIVKKAQFTPTAFTAFPWLEEMRDLCNIIATTTDGVQLQKVMNIFHKKLWPCADEVLNVKQKGVSVLKDELKAFLMFFYLRHNEQNEDFVGDPKYEDLIASMLSVYIDLEVTENRNAKEKEREDIAKTLCGFIGYILREAPTHKLDVLLQTQALEKQNGDLLVPFIRKALLSPETRTCETYTKYIAAVREMAKVIPEEVDSEIKLVAHTVAAPTGYLEWVREINPSVMDGIPETKNFHGVSITHFLLHEADGNLIMELLNLVTPEAEDDSASEAEDEDDSDNESSDEEESVVTTSRKRLTKDVTPSEVKRKKIQEEPLFFVDKGADKETMEKFGVEKEETDDEIEFDDEDIDREYASDKENESSSPGESSDEDVVEAKIMTTEKKSDSVEAMVSQELTKLRKYAEELSDEEVENLDLDEDDLAIISDEENTEGKECENEKSDVEKKNTSINDTKEVIEDPEDTVLIDNGDDKNVGKDNVEDMDQDEKNAKVVKKSPVKRQKSESESDEEDTTKSPKKVKSPKKIMKLDEKEVKSPKAASPKKVEKDQIPVIVSPKGIKSSPRKSGVMVQEESKATSDNPLRSPVLTRHRDLLKQGLSSPVVHLHTPGSSCSKKSCLGCSETKAGVTPSDKGASATPRSVKSKASHKLETPKASKGTTPKLTKAALDKITKESKPEQPSESVTLDIYDFASDNDSILEYSLRKPKRKSVLDTPTKNTPKGNTPTRKAKTSSETQKPVTTPRQRALTKLKEKASKQETDTLETESLPLASGSGIMTRRRTISQSSNISDDGKAFPTKSLDIFSTPPQTYSKANRRRSMPAQTETKSDTTPAAKTRRRSDVLSLKALENVPSPGRIPTPARKKDTGINRRKSMHVVSAIATDAIEEEVEDKEVSFKESPMKSKKKKVPTATLR